MMTYVDSNSDQSNMEPIVFFIVSSLCRRSALTMNAPTLAFSNHLFHDMILFCGRKALSPKSYWLDAVISWHAQVRWYEL